MSKGTDVPPTFIDLYASEYQAKVRERKVQKWHTFRWSAADPRWELRWVYGIYADFYSFGLGLLGNASVLYSSMVVHWKVLRSSVVNDAVLVGSEWRLEESLGKEKYRMKIQKRQQQLIYCFGLAKAGARVVRGRATVCRSRFMSNFYFF